MFSEITYLLYIYSWNTLHMCILIQTRSLSSLNIGMKVMRATCTWIFSSSRGWIFHHCRLCPHKPPRLTTNQDNLPPSPIKNTLYIAKNHFAWVVYPLDIRREMQGAPLFRIRHPSSSAANWNRYGNSMSFCAKYIIFTILKKVSI